MSKIALSGSALGTGTFTIASPNSNTDRTLSLPDNTGTVVSTGSTAVVTQAMLASNVAGNGPAFSAYQTSPNTISAWTKILYQVEEYDTNSNFASSRFTPTVAGYYQISATTSITTPALCVTAIYKNGSEFKRGTYSNNANASGGSVSALVYLNGTTDYIEIYTYSTSSVTTAANSQETWVTGFLARSA